MSVAVIDRNHVVLRGQVAAAAELRQLPSGDTVVAFRLKVRRPQARARGRTLDVLQCVTFDRALQRRVAAWEPGDLVEVEGCLQRRFWRTATGTASVVEVNCRRGRKAARSSGAKAGATA